MNTPTGATTPQTIVTRAEAVALGLKYFYTAVPCPSHGHVSDRLVSTGACRRCNAERSEEWRQKNYTRSNFQKLRSWWKTKNMPAPTRPRPDVCECCGGAELEKNTRGVSPVPKSLALDHCHDTNRFRGWLCRKCNTAIGLLGDNSEGVWRAVEYLLRAGS